MEKFEITILGCSSAIPTKDRANSAQLINVHDHFFLVDCGEGTQTNIWKSGNKISNINHIFISHAHGDHFFGLLPLISTIGLLLNRTDDLHIYLPYNLEEHLRYDINAYCELPYQVVFHSFSTETPELIFESDFLTVTTIPLNHRVPCCGFLFKEKAKPKILIPERCVEYNIPVSEYRNIKDGSDFITKDGKIIPNNYFVKINDFVPRSYAYCSDTACFSEIIEQIKDVSLLYHEATFATPDLEQASATCHSTATQAAQTAKAANANQLLIGHYSNRYKDENILLQEALKIFPNTIAAHDNLKITVSSK